MNLGSLIAILLSTALSGATIPDGTPALTPAKDGSTHAPPPGIGGFRAEVFKFAVDRPDDGKDEAGGWQKASATLNFVDTRPFPSSAWSCPVTVGMAIRSKGDGQISSDKAARTTASVATESSSFVMNSQDEWVPAAFCIKFREKMLGIFKSKYGSMGATVSR